jgi:hypothetical protein
LIQNTWKIDTTSNPEYIQDILESSNNSQKSAETLASKNKNNFNSNILPDNCNPKNILPVKAKLVMSVQNDNGNQSIVTAHPSLNQDISSISRTNSTSSMNTLSSSGGLSSAVLTREMADALSRKLTPVELKAIISLTERLKKESSIVSSLTTEKEDLSARLEVFL